MPNLFKLGILLSACLLPMEVVATKYATRIDQVKWEVSASKFECRLGHAITDFGEGVFVRPAGEAVSFHLYSNNPRMKSGQASLVAKPPAWSKSKARNLGYVSVRQGREPITIDKSMAERMLAELQQGMVIEFARAPWYGGGPAVKVTLSSIGFRDSLNQYVACLANLLPVNFRQVEKSTLYYSEDDEGLSRSAKTQLEQIVTYINADQDVKVLYIDGHTDSQGMRNENLTISEQRAQLVADYLINKGISADAIVTRWHGERYPVVSNKNAKGRAKNRRVTVRLSKKPKPKSMPMVKKESDEANKPSEATPNS